MGYLNRMGFFDHLHNHIEVVPRRPAYSAASIHRGGNNMLVEIALINKDVRDRSHIPYERGKSGAPTTRLHGSCRGLGPQ